MSGTVSPIESAGDLRRALELADKLTQERDCLRDAIMDLIHAYQDHEGGWDRMELPIIHAKMAIGMVPGAEEVDDDDLLGTSEMTPFDG